MTSGHCNGPAICCSDKRFCRTETCETLAQLAQLCTNAKAAGKSKERYNNVMMYQIIVPVVVLFLQTLERRRRKKTEIKSPEQQKRCF